MKALTLLLMFACFLGAEEIPFADAGPYYTRAAQILLPAEITLYFRNNAVLNHAGPGFSPRKIPVQTAFARSPGCYVACRQSGTLRGFVRVAGRYDRQRCSFTPVAGDLCKGMADCAGKCTADAQTGSLFGIAADGSVNTSDCSHDVQVQMNRH